MGILFKEDSNSISCRIVDWNHGIYASRRGQSSDIRIDIGMIVFGITYASDWAKLPLKHLAKSDGRSLTNHRWVGQVH